MNEDLRDAKLFNEKEVAELTHIPLSTLRAHRFYGKGLPYIKIGKAIRYALKDVIEFIEKNKILPRK